MPKGDYGQWLRCKECRAHVKIREGGVSYSSKEEVARLDKQGRAPVCANCGATWSYELAVGRYARRYRWWAPWTWARFNPFEWRDEVQIPGVSKRAFDKFIKRVLTRPR